MESPARQKEQLRKKLRLLTKQQRPAELEEESRLICSKLELSAEFKKAQNLLLYYSMPDEVSTLELIQSWYKQKNILLPVVVDDGNMLLRLYTGAKNLRINCWGIAEPQGPDFLSYDKIDLAVIPGLAFDKQGYRLGRGKAYYDRFLNQLQCPVFGLCFAYRYLESLPVEAWDIPVQRVISSN
jgi:5-formyltetrahydrofolate cyclo-ligase